MKMVKGTGRVERRSKKTKSLFAQHVIQQYSSRAQFQWNRFLPVQQVEMIEMLTFNTPPLFNWFFKCIDYKIWCQFSWGYTLAG